MQKPAYELRISDLSSDVCSSDLDRLEKNRDLPGRNVIDNTERGMKYTAADVAWANAEQTRIFRRFLALFEDIDVLICPACSRSEERRVGQKCVRTCRSRR